MYCKGLQRYVFEVKGERIKAKGLGLLYSDGFETHRYYKCVKRKHGIYSQKFRILIKKKYLRNG